MTAAFGRVDAHDREECVSSFTKDDIILESMGYKKVLDRGLGIVGNWAFGFSEVAILVSITTLYGGGLRVGGPSASVWGFLVVWAMTSVVSLCLAEICSAYPSAGSVYHWSAQLVPERYAPLASYMTGWCNWIGNASGNAAVAYSFSIFLEAALQASRIPAFDNAASVVISIGVSAIWTMMNCLNIADLAAFNNIAALFHAASMLVIIVVLLSTARPLQSARWVFFDYENLTGFTDDARQHALNDKSYVSAMGVLNACYFFSGYEASAHMAEETHESESNAPSGIVNTVLATGVGGFAYILALLFATNDLSRALQTDDAATSMTTCAATNVFITSCGWHCGAVLTWLVVINLFFCGVSCTAVTGRITFALMRDNAFPFSDFFKQVHPIIKSPIRAVAFVFVFVALLLLLPLNPDAATAFQSIVGLCTIGFQVSYAIPIFLKLVWGDSVHVAFPANAKSLGRWSRPFGVVSAVWLCGTSTLFFLPISGPLTVKTNNWLAVVVAGCLLLATAYWFVGDGRSKFRGPKRLQCPATEALADVVELMEVANPLNVDIDVAPVL